MVGRSGQRVVGAGSTAYFALGPFPLGARIVEIEIVLVGDAVFFGTVAPVIVAGDDANADNFATGLSLIDNPNQVAAGKGAIVFLCTTGVSQRYRLFSSERFVRRRNYVLVRCENTSGATLGHFFVSVQTSDKLLFRDFQS